MIPSHQFNVERQFWKLFGVTVRTYDTNRQLLSLASAKAFKLREQITFYQDEAKTKPLFHVRARQIIDLGATYDITDTAGQRLGSLRRKGLSSTFIRDEWLILNTEEAQIGTITEDSNMLGVLRRYIDFVSFFIPQTFHITLNNQQVGTFKQNKNPFTVRLHCEYLPEATAMGEQLMMAIPNVLAIIEARQN